MRDIHLHGALGAEFGKHHRLSVTTVNEVFEALIANFPRFANAVRDGFYRIVLGKTKSSGMALREDQLAGLAIGNRAVHVVPALQGRKRGGVAKVIAGVALIGLSAGAFAPLAGAMSSTIGGTTLGAITGNMGVAMTLAGVANMIAPEQKASDDKKSFTMSGPISDLREGNIVPIVYGEVITGGYMISGAVEVNGPVASPTPTLRNPLGAPTIGADGYGVSSDA